MSKEKMYEVNGVLEYAHCFRVCLKAKSPKDAKRKVQAKLGKLSDPMDAEFQGGIVDKGEITSENEKEHYLFETSLNTSKETK